MPSTRALKSRIRSVSSTKQITKAMQMVAASKMRKTQDATKASTPYTVAASEILTYLASQGATRRHPLFVKREIKNRLLIFVAADKGLAGAYNSNVAKLYTSHRKEDAKAGVHTMTIGIGRRANQYVARLKDTDVVSAYDNIDDNPSGSVLHSILDTAVQKYTDGDVDAVDIVYTEFINGLRQEATTKRILPAGFNETKVSQNIRTAEYEPDVDTVLDAVVYRLVGAQIFQALLDAKASEYSMRMIAMKNATDNANDLVDDLTLAMNKARQGAITQELAEISGGVEALK